MLLTISTTHKPATDLGYLLHKHPDKCQTFSLTFGEAHVFYPEASEAQCTVALLLEMDPVRLIRRPGKGRNQGFSLTQYVNDRPYVASSFLSVAIAKVFGSALSGRCKDRPEVVNKAIPLVAKISAVPDASEGALVKRLFEPLGYEVSFEGGLLDERFPDWGDRPYLSLNLKITARLAELLSHIYVLIPVLDNFKHYWVGDDEVKKLLNRAGDWLNNHPEKEFITTRYLKYKKPLTRAALSQLLVEEGRGHEDAEAANQKEEEALEKPLSLHEQRLNTVLAVLKARNVRRVLDLGCGEGKLIRKLLKEPQFAEIVGFDISYRTIEIAKKRLYYDRMPPMQQQRLTFLNGSLTYKDSRLEGYDGAAIVEVIEHLDESRLEAFERVVFANARPGVVVITTPNAEYNVRFESLPAGQFRHRDHRFEWTRNEFQQWATRIAKDHGYTVQFLPVGPEDPEVGAPSQMGVFAA